MDNILYIDDYINLYNKKNNKIFIIKPYKNTLKNGLVIDKNKFIKKFNLMLENHNLKTNFFNESITVIINNLYTKEDKELIKIVLEELNYKKIKFVQELELLKINKNILYINCNKSFYYFIYTNYLGNIDIGIYQNNDINKVLLINAIKYINKSELILYGKNYKEIENVIKKEIKEYYYFEDNENLLIKLLLNKKMCKVEKNRKKSL